MLIRIANSSDADQISQIYNYYINHSHATFELVPVSSAIMKNRLSTVQTNGLPWLVAEDTSGEIVGYAYASKWKERQAYQHSVEITVYLAHDKFSAGIGTLLYTALFDELKTRSVHAVMGGISLPNDASIALHEKFGMQKVAHFAQVGRKFDNWIDVGYWQIILQ